MKLVKCLSVLLEAVAVAVVAVVSFMAGGIAVVYGIGYAAPQFHLGGAGYAVVFLTAVLVGGFLTGVLSQLLIRPSYRTTAAVATGITASVVCYLTTNSPCSPEDYWLQSPILWLVPVPALAVLAYIHGVSLVRERRARHLAWLAAICLVLGIVILSHNTLFHLLPAATRRSIIISGL